MIIVVDSNVGELSKYQGAQGNKDALELIKNKIPE
jgi:hypothetical protein